MEIHLVRHGLTEANEKGLYCGRTDLPLSDAGAAELAALMAQGIYPSPAALYFTSGMLRAEQTLDALYGKVERAPIRGLAECDFGVFEMKTYDELNSREDYQAWIDDFTGDAACPGGESKNSFAKRVVEAYGAMLREVMAAGGESAFVACHGGTIACVLDYLLPNADNFYGWQPMHGRGYTLTYEDGRFRRYKAI